MSISIKRVQKLPRNKRYVIEFQANMMPRKICSYLLGLLLELLDGPLVDTTALVDQVAGGGRLAGVDVANDHDVDVNLLLNHLVGLGRS